jgi:mRNA interferase RelE/StbE
VTYRVSYTDSFSRDLKALDPQIARRIVKFLAQRIDGTDDPRQFGQALRGARLGELWRYRVGDWRIIANIEDDTLTVLALHAGHRRDIYQ